MSWVSSPRNSKVKPEDPWGSFWFLHLCCEKFNAKIFSNFFPLDPRESHLQSMNPRSKTVHQNESHLKGVSYWALPLTCFRSHLTILNSFAKTKARSPIPSLSLTRLIVASSIRPPPNIPTWTQVCSWNGLKEKQNFKGHEGDRILRKYMKSTSKLWDVTICSVTVYKSKYKKERGRRSGKERERNTEKLSVPSCGKICIKMSKVIRPHPRSQPVHSIPMCTQ